MNELDRWGDSAALTLLDEVTGAETEEALAMVRNGASGERAERPRYAVLALAAAAIIVLVAGVALIKSRETDEVEPPLASPPTSAPVTTPVESTIPTAPPTSGPSSEPGTSAAPPTTPATTAPPLTAPPTSAPTATIPPVPALADQPDFGGASTVAFAGGGEIVVSGAKADGSPVLWHYAAGTWTSTALPGDNGFVPIAFVDSRNGFVYADGSVQQTTDGGATWNPLELASPSGGGVSVIGLAVGAGNVHALAVDEDGSMTFRIYTMPLVGGSFTASDVTFPPPAGGEPVASFAFDGDSGWMAVTSRTLMGAAEFVAGQWSAADITCVNGGVTFASSGVEGDLVRSCDSGFMGSDGSIPEGTQLEVSADGGQTFGGPIELPSGASPFFTLLARPYVGTIVIGGQGDTGPLVLRDEAGGWQPLGLPQGSAVADLEADSNSGLWVAAGSTSDGTQTVWVSADGGATWTG